MPGRVTPMFRQWMQAKAQHPDALLFFRMGDFYELFFDDAKLAAPVMEVALTSRGKGTETEAPMCGVPHHAVDQYVARLIERGHRVAICEQMEDPRKTKGMVRREVVRVVSPGTVIDPLSLSPGEGNWLAAVHGAPGGPWGVAYADLSTGAFVLGEAADDAGLADALARHEVREVLAAERHVERLGAVIADGAGRGPLVTAVADDRFHPALAKPRVLEALGVSTLAGFGCSDDHRALPAAAAALAHLRDTQRARPAHLDRLRVETPDRVMTLDATTRRNLEIVAAARDGAKNATLLGVLDRTSTPMGARRLRALLLEPLRDVAEIRARHDVVGDFVARGDLRRDAREALGDIRDLERLLGRAALGAATPADLAALRRSLRALAPLRAAVGGLPSERASELAMAIDPLDDLRDALEAALADEPGPVPGEGRVIREGFDAELDEARSLARDSRSHISALETKEREATGIASLKIRYNRVFGYYIEISRANVARVPERYERRQTIATGERYVTPEIRELETRILGAEERQGERERALFDALVAEVVARAARLRGTASAVADVDALASFAEAAALADYVRPTIDDGDAIEIVDGRHPVVEALLPRGAFVPNDCTLDANERLLVVTGPNMGGKSTFLRQVALIVIAAQAGSFVPAGRARIGVVDRVFCRVGASDNLAQGESTFMVEMTETANILHNASPRSLVILDEIGRGTATWDGMAIAWAVVEHLHDDPRLQPKALFATHYHELTELAARLPRLANVHIAVREHGHDIVFLHRVERGPSDRSYGIHVARLAGLPDRVVARARQILEELSAQSSPADRLLRAEGRVQQLGLFDAPSLSPGESSVLDEVRGIDPDGVTPRDALDLIARWKAKLGPR